MIRRVQILNYRGLRYVDVPLGEFQLLVGLNGSGKSTLLDAVRFVSDLVREGPAAAVRQRAQSFKDLVWGCTQQAGITHFELALEFDIPEPLQAQLPAPYKLFRYEVAVRGEGARGAAIHAECCLLLRESSYRPPPAERHFPVSVAATAPKSILSTGDGAGAYRVAMKPPAAANGTFRRETEAGARWLPAPSIGPQRSALSALATAQGFPVTGHIAQFLKTGVLPLHIDVRKLREPCPFSASACLQPNGANLPWLAKRLREENEVHFKEWVSRVSCFSPGLAEVRVVVAPASAEAERRAYLMLRMKNGMEIPAWSASDGMLRALVLALVPHQQRPGKTYLIDDVESGLNPAEFSDIYYGLAGPFGWQVLAATHSLELLQYERDLKNVLSFGIASDGTVDVTRGDHHPYMQNEDITPMQMGELFADYETN